MKLVDARTRGFLAYFAGAHPARTLLMVGLLVISGLLEGVSAITLVPVLEASGGGGGSSRIGSAVRSALVQLGVEPRLEVLVGLLVLGIALKSLFLWLAMRQVGFTEARVTLELRLQLVRALLRARWSYFGTHPVGRFANTVSSEAVRAAAAYREGCVVLAGLVQVLVYLGVAALISWEVSLAAGVAGVVLVSALKRFVGMGRAAGEEQTRRTKSLVALLVDALQGMKPMKAMAREELFWPILEREAEGLNQAHRRHIVAAETLRLFQEPAVALLLGTGLVVLLTVAQWSFSTVIALAFVFFRLMTAVNTLQMRYQIMAGGESAFWSIREQIDEARDAEERHAGTLRPTGLGRAIELRGVSFSYGGLRVLDELSVSIPAGRLTALVGRSGSGKSTIVDLITGLRRPSHGDVYVDGTPLGELELKGWRQLIGYVPQDVFLFHDTVRRNVTLGDDSISDARVERALRDAGAWEFIARDPAGIHAVIAPQGSSLSGGQRQRLAIARALVREPALVVLDEATTGLDGETEEAILDTLRALRGRVTLLAISHQRALRDAADLTLELEAGRIARGETSLV